MGKFCISMALEEKLDLSKVIEKTKEDLRRFIEVLGGIGFIN